MARRGKMAVRLANAKMERQLVRLYHAITAPPATTYRIGNAVLSVIAAAGIESTSRPVSKKNAIKTLVRAVSTNTMPVKNGSASVRNVNAR